MPIKLYQEVSKLIWPMSWRSPSPGLKNVRVRWRRGSEERQSPATRGGMIWAHGRKPEGAERTSVLPGTVLTTYILVVGPRTLHLLLACFPGPNSQGPLPFHPHHSQGQGPGLPSSLYSVLHEDRGRLPEWEASGRASF